VTGIPETDYLFVCAEIAAAFVGFASVVAILGRRSGRDDASVDAFRLRIMLEAGILTVFAALLPVVLYRAGLEDLTRRVSSGFNGPIGIATFIRAIRRSRLAATTPETRKFGQLIGSVFFSRVTGVDLCGVWSTRRFRSFLPRSALSLSIHGRHRAIPRPELPPRIGRWLGSHLAKRPPPNKALQRAINSSTHLTRVATWRHTSGAGSGSVSAVAGR